MVYGAEIPLYNAQHTSLEELLASLPLRAKPRAEIRGVKTPSSTARPRYFQNRFPQDILGQYSRYDRVKNTHAELIAAKFVPVLHLHNIS